MQFAARAVDVTSQSPGPHALALIEQVLRGQPDKDDHALSEATMCLAALRDATVAQWRAGGIDDAGRARVRRLNAVITVVLGVHYPLGAVPWAELAGARDWLADIVHAHEGAQ